MNTSQLSNESLTQAISDLKPQAEVIPSSKVNQDITLLPNECKDSFVIFESKSNLSPGKNKRQAFNKEKERLNNIYLKKIMMIQIQ
jgi:hypothetical protein